jgi:YVTN family beta-propeller protein
MRLTIGAILFTALAAAQTAEQPVRAVTDPGVVTTRQNITPAGTHSIFDKRVYGVAFGTTADELWVLNGSQVFRLDWKRNQVLARVSTGGNAGMQGLRFDAASGRALVSSTVSNKVRLSAVSGTRAEVLAGGLGGQMAGAVTLTKGLALVALTFDNKLGIVDLAAKQARTSDVTGIAPFAAAANAAGTIAYVSNWGGRVPKPGEPTAPTGLAATADQVLIDGRGVAATGTVARVDLVSGKVTHSIATGLHPLGLAWDEGRNALYVGNANSDSISVIDTRANRVVRTIAIEPFGRKLPGIAPTAMTMSKDGARLFVALGGLNAVVVIEALTGKLAGLIPTAWYPNSLALSGDGAYLAVGTLLGPGSGWRDEPKQRFVHSNRGSVAVLPLPDAAQLASYTTAVAENSHIPLEAARTAPSATPKAVPARAGDASPIEHVVYILKENRTYDQVLGAVAKGNGDPSLVMFGEDVTPNHHRLAEQFVVLDNFYASGGNSANGHQWATQANEMAYTLWPGYTGRSYPYDGTDPIAYARNGFIWDAALARKKSVQVFGEFIPRLTVPSRERHVLLERWKKGDDFTKEWQVKSPIPPLDRILARNYPSYSTEIPDVARAQIFLTYVNQWQTAGNMPNLVIVQLPSDHTRGTSAGTSSAKAMVADNDVALGQIVEALTKTPFWKKMAIFVVEDDAQNGVDHVDGHRTVALVASPYARRAHVDSTFYSHQSILKTIELMLGLPTLSLFDLIANDMRASFTDQPDFGAYRHVMPKQSLFERNPEVKGLRGTARQDAIASAKMRFDVPDAAPTERLNRILWRNIKGAVPYPGTKRAVFAPLSLDIDDDDR